MNLIIVDFEATCSNDDSFPREEMEIIEIGAVALDEATADVVQEFSSFVRPVLHPVLTSFCRELTGIKQEEVDSAQTFPSVHANFVKWLADFQDATFCSWGRYDKNQLTRDCAFHGCPYPFSPAHRNLKEEFAVIRRSKKQSGVGTALHQLGLSFIGNQHRALDDSRNIARIYREAIWKKVPV